MPAFGGPGHHVVARPPLHGDGAGATRIDAPGPLVAFLQADRGAQLAGRLLQLGVGLAV
jgi:hypothetical protein